MNSYRSSKFERPGSSARVYDYENSNYESLERRSKIPKMPKRTYSLEGKKSSYINKRANERTKTSATSMIPRPEWKRPKKIVIEQPNIGETLPDTPTQPVIKSSEQPPVIEMPVTTTPSCHSHSLKSAFSLKNKVNNDLVTFKNSVLRIPEYWTDAGETVTNILKNAVNIITKQYPTADVESFEKDIESILKATETVKQQILLRTENIINKANQIYLDKNDRNPAMTDEDLKKITRKISDLKNEVYYRKNVFGDLLKYGSEMKELLELEKSLKQKALLKEIIKRDDSRSEAERNDNENRGHGKDVDGKKSKPSIDLCAETTLLHPNKKSEKHSLQSCGDIVRQGTKILLEAEAKSSIESRPSAEEKSTQTHKSWCEELRTREKDLKELNRQISELHQLCKDHISKFKNFNLQIKMRGIGNKLQQGTKEIYVHNDNKTEVLEKKNSMALFTHLDSAIKQKDLDVHQKEKLLNQQKKFLHVRDELIGMLKNRCTLEEQKRY